MRKIKLMAATSAVALLAAGSAYAADPVEREGMSLVVYGQVNYMAAYMDNGQQGDFLVANSVSSTSRFGFKAKGQINDDLALGTTIEYGVGKSGIDNRNYDLNENLDDSVIFRHAYWWVKSASAGRLAVGHTDTATNGLGEIDISGTGVLDLGLTGWSNGGSFQFDNGTTINGVFGGVGLDGNSRQDVVRYDTPSIGGLKAAVSVTGDGDLDAALRYARAFGDIKVVAGAGISDRADADAVNELVNAGAGIKHSSGLSIYFAYADREGTAANNTEAWNVKAGYSANLNEYGPTHFAISYGEAETNNVDGETIGVSIVQDISHLGANFYLGYRNWDADGAGDQDGVFAGARVKF